MAYDSQNRGNNQGYSGNLGGNHTQSDSRKNYSQNHQTNNPQQNSEQYVAKWDNIVEDFGTEAKCTIEKNELHKKIKTNQIRNVLSMIASLYTAELGKTEELSSETKKKLQYIKIKIAYSIGRDSFDEKKNNWKLGTKPFNNAAKIYEFIDEAIKSRENFNTYCNYVEALVAYHKYFGGKE
ncbi:hypothetical protein AGMMS49938_12400 [Fibrobacterales bacterium]|nr:hypothetical protein AGMMS49938_12400 [Fibrobacterales bacterium]